ncbi:hypothetical protein [Kitasatospora terrestris]|uniref:Organic hydroperoxide resistance protein n=1 Tax=Kitasatospora terrestris TaxID=258051 RepID=A0ABP9D8T0_9ACTN
MLLPDGAGFRLGVDLRIDPPSVTTEQAVELARTAHRICPYSNATRDNVEVALVVNSTRL